MKTNFTGILIVAIILSSSACSPSLATQPSPTQAYTPTHIEAPTPTSSPIPASVPPPLEILETYLEGVQVLSTEPFNELSTSNWEFTPDTIKVSDGILEITGKQSGMTWYSVITRSAAEISEGEGFVVLFKFDDDSQFDITLQHGKWDTQELRAFGIVKPSSGKPAEIKMCIFEGSENLNKFAIPRGDLLFMSNTWYYLMIVAASDGEFMLAIWDPANPSADKIYRERLDKWNGISLTLNSTAQKGKVFIDEFWEISFSKVKQ